MFAAYMLVLASLAHLAQWIIALFRSTFYVPSATYLFGDVRTWGWIQLAIGLVMVAAAVGILDVQEWGRWLGIGIAIVSVLAQLFFVNASPWQAVVVIGIDIVIIYALTRYGVEPMA
jgi:hypothetical protein